MRHDPNSPAGLDQEVGRARRYPAAAASLIILGILLLLTPKLLASLFSAQWFGLPAGLVFIGLSWVGLVGLSWVAQRGLAPMILDRQSRTPETQIVTHSETATDSAEAAHSETSAEEARDA